MSVLDEGSRLEAVWELGILVECWDLSRVKLLTAPSENEGSPSGEGA